MSTKSLGLWRFIFGHRKNKHRKLEALASFWN